MQPVRPSAIASSETLLGLRRDADEGDEDREDDAYSPTDMANEQVNMEDVDEADAIKEPEITADEEPMICSPCGNARIPSSLSSPIRPSAEDVDDHYRTHLPYRNWCPVCVRAKGKEAAHPRDAQHEEDKSGLPIVSMDYQTLNEKTQKEQRMIIGKDQTTGNVFGHFVTCKGLGDEWVIR